MKKRMFDTLKTIRKTENTKVQFQIDVFYFNVSLYFSGTFYK